MHACIHKFRYVCVYACIYELTLYLCMYVWYVCLFVCLFVCVYYINEYLYMYVCDMYIHNYECMTCVFDVFVIVSYHNICMYICIIECWLVFVYVLFASSLHSFMYEKVKPHITFMYVLLVYVYM